MNCPLPIPPIADMESAAASREADIDVHEGYSATMETRRVGL
jgi:hypothetical protein